MHKLSQRILTKGFDFHIIFITDRVKKNKVYKNNAQTVSDNQLQNQNYYLVSFYYLPIKKKFLYSLLIFPFNLIFPFDKIARAPSP